MLKKMFITNWRQFSQLNIDFHDRLTVITGANGAGKSTILKIISQNFGENHSYLATPVFTDSGSKYYYQSWFDYLYEELPPKNTIGYFIYSNGNESSIVLQGSTQISYNVKIHNMTSVPGIYINSHQPVPSYQEVETIPAGAVDAGVAYKNYKDELDKFEREIHKKNALFFNFTPLYRMKEALISMAMFGPGNKFVQKNESAEILFYKFKDILAKILPDEIGFVDVIVRVPDVILLTDAGEFVLDASSGGLMAIINMAWQIFIFSQQNKNFVALIDEPENHLHPSMQRTLLPKLLSTFDNVQFIIVTHSPFMVSSVKDSNVYVLRHVDLMEKMAKGVKRMVTSIKLDDANKAGTASDILREVLGVPVTMPKWAEAELNSITEAFSVDALDAGAIKELRSRLDLAGLAEYYPEAIRDIADRR